MEQTLISRQNLAKRWDYSSTKPIEAFEREGVLTRVNLPGSIRYSLEEVMRIELIGEVNPLSPLERVKLIRRIEWIEKENDTLKSKLNQIKMMIGD